jgi:predicted N-acyltransferase
LNYYHQIYLSTVELPADWNQVAQSSIFLQTDYLKALEESRPTNLTISYVGIFQDTELIAAAFIQQIDLIQLETFGVRDSGLKIIIRDFLFKNYAGKLLIVGNNMLTGQHAIACRPDISQASILSYLKERVCKEYPNQHLEIFKDFPAEELNFFSGSSFDKSLRFTSQPSMFLSLAESWEKEKDYVEALTKKYRDQYKRARKKADGIEKRQLNLTEIIELESRIYELYFHVAKNAPFNTFFLVKNHFSCLKENMGESFRFCAYFEEGKLIGFNTLFQHDELLETYFLGYDPSIQKDKMLYLNMLYDMVGCAIVNGFKHIQFGRTAMEIKSSIGAIPVNMYGLMEHNTPLINSYLDKIFRFLEPEVTWTQRHPFKEKS